MSSHLFHCGAGLLPFRFPEIAFLNTFYCITRNILLSPARQKALSLYLRRIHRKISQDISFLSLHFVLGKAAACSDDDSCSWGLRAGRNGWHYTYIETGAFCSCTYYLKHTSCVRYIELFCQRLISRMFCPGHPQWCPWPFPGTLMSPTALTSLFSSILCMCPYQGSLISLTFSGMLLTPHKITHLYSLA